MSFNFFKKHKSSGLFIPSGDDYKEVTDKIENASLNGISEHLGYHSDQLHFHFGKNDINNDIQQVAFEIFTDKIVFILTKDTVNRVDKKKLKDFSSNYNKNEEFDSIRVRDILKDGIENKSLTIAFLSKVLGLNSNDDGGGILFSEKLGLYLYFADNYLVDFQSADGLNEWAKFLRDLNQNLFDSYVKVARKYWGDNLKMIENEVNIQGESLSSAPDALKNKFVQKHNAELGTVNFFMLLVCHYGQQINEDTFKTINHGRYTYLEDRADVVKKYKYNSFILHFSGSGELIEIEE